MEWKEGWDKIRQFIFDAYEIPKDMQRQMAFPNTLTDEEAATLRAEIENLYAGPESAGKILVLKPGVSISAMGVPQEVFEGKNCVVTGLGIGAEPPDEADSPIIVER